jgi:hypothetical protein
VSATRTGGAAVQTGGELRVHAVRVNVPPAHDLPVAERKELQQRERLLALLVALAICSQYRATPNGDRFTPTPSVAA